MKARLSRRSSRRAVRVCLIVDHPSRDLEGLIRLAHELARRGIEVLLTPMHELHEISLLVPDLVVLNYVKPPYLPFVELCARLGIAVVVLDTEGIHADLFARNAGRMLDGIAVYCVWGMRQYEALVASDAGRRLRLEVTGCPRYDFVAAPWRSALKRPTGVEGKFVLVNTNFPLINPRFQSAQREAKEMVQVAGFASDFVEERIRQTRIALDEMLSTTRALASALPGLTFVLRPHPFEDPSLYEKALVDSPNVHVRQEGSVFEWINHAVAVIHHHCLTAVDAAMMQVEPLHVAWLPTPALEVPVAAAVSRHVRSLEELETAIQLLRSGDRLPDDRALSAERARVVQDWFYRADGKAAERVADAVVSRLGHAEPGRGGRWSVLAGLLFHRGSLKRSLQTLLLLTLGCGAYRWVRAALRGDLRTKGKMFATPEVQSVLDRLDAVTQGQTVVRSRPVSARDARLGTPGPYSSVSVSVEGRSAGSVGLPEQQPGSSVGRVD